MQLSNSLDVKFVEGFLFCALLQKAPISLPQLRSLFSNTFLLTCFGGNTSKLEDIFSRALAQLFMHYGVTHDDGETMILSVNRQFWKPH